MRRATLVFALLCSVLFLLIAGCGGGGGGNALLPDGGQTLRMGNMEVQTEATANFKTMALKGKQGADVALTVLYGAKVTRLAELRRVDRIVFDTNRDGNAEIYSMFTDGSNVTRLTNNSATDQDPVWSPDGTKIAFTSNRDGNLNVYVMNADGTGQTPVTSHSAADTHPAWSPDGTKLAFRTNRDGQFDIYTMNADGSSASRCTNNIATDTSPDWSPDGTQIAFTSDRDGDYEIFTMNTDGTNQTQRTANTGEDEGSAWLPTGQKIMFASDRDGNYNLYMMDPDGTDQTALHAHDGDDFSGRWAPSGQQIVLVSNAGGDNDILTMAANGTNRTCLTNNTFSDMNPDWCRVLSPPTTWRTLIGSSGSDGGYTPPFGSYRHLVVVGMGDEGMVSAASLAYPSDSTSVVPEPMDYGGTALTVLKLTGSPVYGIVEDDGRGRPTVFWDTVTSSMTSGAVLVFFSGKSGRIVSVIASVDTTAASAGGSVSPMAQTAGGRVVLTGAFTAAYDADDRDGNRVSGTASKIVLDESTGRILSVE